MTKEKIHNVRLGIFVFVGLVLLIFGLYSIGKNRNMFGSSITVFAQFYDVNGLIEGNNVRYESYLLFPRPEEPQHRSAVVIPRRGFARDAFESRICTSEVLLPSMRSPCR